MKKLFGLVVALLIAAALMPAAAFAAPTIVVINPSPLATGIVPELSDKADRPVHLVAWVGDAPSNPLVEFEISIAGQNAVTVDATRAGSDTWEAFFVIPPTLAEGQYTVTARLYSNAEEVASNSQLARIDREDIPPATDNVEITEPDNGGAIGFFTAVDRAAGVVRVNASDGTDQVQVFYTTKAPGTQPDWIGCGRSAPGTAGVTAVRCLLQKDHTPQAVTAIAAVANQTPTGETQRPADDAMDAHRVTAYAAVPTRVDVSPEAVKYEVGKCPAAPFVATVTDQRGAPVPTVNVDLHAQGPSDQLQFATIDTTPLTSANFQAPDKSHSSKEAARRCSDGSNLGEQGDHNVIGNPDRKHIESIPFDGTRNGTNNDGQFSFALFSPSQGGTSVIAWADVNDDDVQSLSEATGSARIGWGEDPPPPVREVFVDAADRGNTGSCVPVTTVVRESGASVVGVNVDVHLQGEGAGFCPVSGGSVPRPPDLGDHTGGSHSDGTLHGEGETDGSGRFVFGVTSATQGTVKVGVWQDQADDDTMAPSEPSANASIDFGVAGERSISIRRSRRSVPAGNRVRISGAISAQSPTCETGQLVKLQARRTSGATFRTVGRKTTGSDGSYGFRPRINASTVFRAVAPRAGGCDLARSKTVRVDAT